ncbi:MAG: serine/threonine protein kinase [Spirochaetales bacterium]|nr:serine/threonine protein kinase [Spirochaetales bacterium]
MSEKTETGNPKTLGKKIGKYRNAQLLAEGGMGAIYRAEHPTLDQTVVLKKLTQTGSEQFQQRFQREATIMMGFQHENIVNYYDHFKVGQASYMAMEYVDGPSLAQLISDERYLDDELALLIVRDVLRALDYAHNKGVVHRDIKPANILLASDGRVKLTDFGIALADETLTNGLTREGMALGTPFYMAPEQFRDATMVDSRADLYSVGVLLYEALTGRKPFSGASLPEILENVQRGRYEKLKQARPDSLRICQKTVQKSIRSAPKRRVSSSQSLLRPIERYLRKRNEGDLRSRLARIIRKESETENPIPHTKSSLHRIKTVLGWAFGGLLLLGVCLFGWLRLSLEAYLPAWIQPRFLGALVLEVPFPPGEGRLPDVVLDVYQTGLEGPVPIRTHIVARSSQKEIYDEREDAGVLSIRPVLLPPGEYLCRIRVGDEVISQALSIMSLQEQNHRTDGENSMVKIRIPWSPKTAPVTVQWTLRRGESGMEYALPPQPRVIDSSGMVYAVEGEEVLLNSGDWYDFFFEVPGYHPISLRAWLEPGLENYELIVDLQPQLAQLMLSTNQFVLWPKLNGKRIFPGTGSQRGGVLPLVSKEETLVELPPGEYLLSAGASEDAQHHFTLDTGMERHFRWMKNDDGTHSWVELNQ